MKIPTYTCDVCMTNKPDTDGWWALTLDMKSPVPQLKLKPFDTDDTEMAGHACSKQCAATITARFLDDAKVDVVAKEAAKKHRPSIFDQWFKLGSED